MYTFNIFCFASFLPYFYRLFVFVWCLPCHSMMCCVLCLRTRYETQLFLCALQPARLGAKLYTKFDGKITHILLAGTHGPTTICLSNSIVMCIYSRVSAYDMGCCSIFTRNTHVPILLNRTPTHLYKIAMYSNCVVLLLWVKGAGREDDKKK